MVTIWQQRKTEKGIKRKLSDPQTRRNPLKAQVCQEGHRQLADDYNTIKNLNAGIAKIGRTQMKLLGSQTYDSKEIYWGDLD